MNRSVGLFGEGGDRAVLLFSVCPSGVHHGDGTVVITMIAVGVMQMPSDQVVEVIAVGNRLVTAAGTVNVSRVVATAIVLRSTCIGIVLAD